MFFVLTVSKGLGAPRACSGVGGLTLLVSVFLGMPLFFNHFSLAGYAELFVSLGSLACLISAGTRDGYGGAVSTDDYGSIGLCSNAGRKKYGNNLFAIYMFGIFGKLDEPQISYFSSSGSFRYHTSHLCSHRNAASLTRPWPIRFFFLRSSKDDRRNDRCECWGPQAATH